MKDLTDNQLALLNLCKRNPEPVISEIVSWHSVYDISCSTLRSDLVDLLVRRFIQPASQIDRRLFLPRTFVLSEEGAGYLRDFLSEQPERTPEEHLERLDFEAVENRLSRGDELIQDWPDISNTSSEELEELAETYLHWALFPKGSGWPEPHHYFEIAALGFGKVEDSRRFRKAIRAWFETELDRGKFLDMPERTLHLMDELPDFGELILAVSWLALRVPCRDLLGNEVPQFVKVEDMRQLRERLRSETLKLASNYEILPVDIESLHAAFSRLFPLLRIAFRTKEATLLGDAMKSAMDLLRVFRSVVLVRDTDDRFEATAGFGPRCDLASEAFDWIHSLATIVESDDPLRKECQILIEELWIAVAQSMFGPVKKTALFDKSGFVRGLLEAPASKLQLVFRRKINRLIGLLKTYPELFEANDVPLPKDYAAANNALLRDLITLINQTRDEDLRSTNEAVVFQEEVRKNMAELITAQGESNSILMQNAKLILGMSEVIRKIDYSLDEMKDDIRESICDLQHRVSTDSEIPSEQKESFLKELGEIVKLNSAGQMIMKVPLIPGFLEYNRSLQLDISWNKWLEKLGKLIG